MGERRGARVASTQRDGVRATSHRASVADARVVDAADETFRLDQVAVDMFGAVITSLAESAIGVVIESSLASPPSGTVMRDSMRLIDFVVIRMWGFMVLKWRMAKRRAMASRPTPPRKDLSAFTFKDRPDALNGRIPNPCAALLEDG